MTSRSRQLGQAEALVAGHGQIVTRFFDSRLSRTLAWARRPQAAALGILGAPFGMPTALFGMPVPQAYWDSQPARLTGVRSRFSEPDRNGRSSITAR